MKLPLLHGPCPPAGLLLVGRLVLLDALLLLGSVLAVPLCLTAPVQWSAGGGESKSGRKRYEGCDGEQACSAGDDYACRAAQMVLTRRGHHVRWGLGEPVKCNDHHGHVVARAPVQAYVYNLRSNLHVTTPGVKQVSHKSGSCRRRRPWPC